MKKIFDVIKNNPLFRGLDENDIKAVLKNAGARTKAVTAGEYILHLGDTTSETGIVLYGSVLIVQEDLWGHRSIISHIRAGDIFAELFAASGDMLNVSVVTHEDGEILFLDVDCLLPMQKSSDERSNIVIRNFISILAKKTMAFNEKVTHISKRTTKEKLLSYLSAQSVRHGSLSFSIPFDRQQLADYLCVDRAAMSAELSKLQKAGVLRYKKNYFELKELAEII